MTNILTAGQFLPRAITDTALFLGFRDGDKHADRLSGKCVANWLESIGETVTEFRDTGSNGLAITASGFAVSTNGYVSRT